MNADMEGADGESTVFAQANLSNVLFRGADLESADFLEAKAVGANFTGANLGRARLSKADFSEANLEAADLGSARLEQTIFKGANLRLLRLSPRLIKEAPPSGEADDALEASGLSDDSRVGALMVKTDFQNADLTDAQMQDTVIYQANLDGANLTDANLTGSRWLEVSLNGTICTVSPGNTVNCEEFVLTDADQIQQSLALLNQLKARPYPED